MIYTGHDGGKAGVIECVDEVITRQRHAKHVSPAMNTHETTEDILEEVISMRLSSQ